MGRQSLGSKRKNVLGWQWGNRPEAKPWGELLWEGGHWAFHLHLNGGTPVTPLPATAAWPLRLWGAHGGRVTPPGWACLPLPVKTLQLSEVRSSGVGVQGQS